VPHRFEEVRPTAHESYVQPVNKGQTARELVSRQFDVFPQGESLQERRLCYESHLVALLT
jgi:hypothetical protein